MCAIVQGDPILLVERPDAFDYFWTNYVKGAARSATLLMLASVVMEQGWDLSILNPALQASMVTIFARHELMIADSEAVAFANARLSAHGSIRRAHCTLTWLGVFQALQKSGLSAPEVLKRWNQQATSASQVTGMSMSAEIVDALLAHLSAHAGSTAFQEDAFANKRLVIGAAPRTSSKEWNQRLCVTSEGMLMMIRFISHAHERKLPGARCKYDKPSLEEALNMSQLLVSALTEAAQQYPIHQDAASQVVQSFLDGNMALELELQSALAERSSKWTCSDLHTIKKLISEHVSESHAHLQKLGKNTAVEAAALERQEFDLVMQTLDHDLDVWKAHLTRSKDRQAAVHFQLMQHRQKRLSASKELADKQIDQVTALMPLDTAQETFKLVETKVKQICQVQQLSDPNQIQTLVVLNWAAPCLFTAEHQRLHSQLAGAFVNHPGREALGALISPVYCRTRGTAHKQEKICHDALSQSNCNLDDQFVLPFKGKNDEREKRTGFQQLSKQYVGPNFPNVLIQGRDIPFLLQLKCCGKE